jgi:hypothetical protein
MVALAWDETGQRFYETGVDHGVLYLPNSQGDYDDGVAWNGLVTVTESPSGAEPSAQYADNIKYLNLFSAEEFGATIEAFTYPDEFAAFDGLGVPTPGVSIGQQSRRGFGLSYRTKIGNDIEGDDLGYKLHLVYGCQASPSEKAYGTINDSPEAITFSWEVTTTPVGVGVIDGVTYKPTSVITIDSTKVNAAALAALEEILYGTAGVDPALPPPATVIGMFTGTVTEVAATQPTFDQPTNTITIPTVVGVTYYVNDEPVAAGPLVITEDTIVVARANPGYVLTPGTDNDWFYPFV